MRYFIFALPLAAAAAVASSKLPTKTVLPIPIDSNIASGNGFASLGDTYVKSAESLSLHADNIDSVSTSFSGDVSDSNAFPNVPVSFQLAQTLANVNQQLWATATEAEKKVCAIATSIDKQKTESQKGNLINGVQAQASAVAKLQTSLAGSISTIQSLSSTFSDEEKAIFVAAINNLVKSSEASALPLSKLAEGLKTLGLKDVTDSIGDLQAAVKGFSQTAASVQTF